MPTNKAEPYSRYQKPSLPTQSSPYVAVSKTLARLGIAPSPHVTVVLSGIEREALMLNSAMT